MGLDNAEEALEGHFTGEQAVTTQDFPSEADKPSKKRNRKRSRKTVSSFCLALSFRMDSFFLFYQKAEPAEVPLAKLGKT